MAELIHLAQRFMNAEDTIIAKRKKKGERRKLRLGRKEIGMARRQDHHQVDTLTILL